MRKVVQKNGVQYIFFFRGTFLAGVDRRLPKARRPITAPLVDLYCLLFSTLECPNMQFPSIHLNHTNSTNLIYDSAGLSLVPLRIQGGNEYS